MCNECGYYTFVDWCFFFFKQKTAYEMRISDWSSDVCSSDLDVELRDRRPIRIGLDALPDALILEHVHAVEFGAEMLKDRHRAARKAALREQRAAFHEQQHVASLHLLVDPGIHIVGHRRHSFIRVCRW